MRYTTILFDADGTLFDFDQAEVSALAKAFAEFGLVFTPERHQIYHQINESKWKLFEARVITKTELQFERFNDFFAVTGIANIDAASFNMKYLDYLSESAQLIDGAYDVCRVLAADRLLAIITNGVERTQYGRLAHSTIRPFISHLFVSEKIGAAKPDPEYFDYVFKELRYAEKRRTLIVGDSPASDILGGNRYGVDTCYYNPNGKVLDDTGVKPTYEVVTLQQILSLV